MPSTERHPADLRAYILAKQEVADLVREAATVEGPGGALSDSCRELLVRLAEDRFNLAVVGQFKRGKSTLLNAMVGRDVLPAGVLPLTSAITSLRYGPRERALLRWRGRTFQQEVTLGELADFVTERGNPGNKRGLTEAVVELPAAVLRRGVWLIDTPGVGSSREANTLTTLAFLPEAAAVVLVTSADGPLGEIEEGFLRQIRAHVRKLLVVLNKVDIAAPDERDALVAFVRSRIAEQVGVVDVPVYALSAAQALSARLGHDARLLEGSGLVAFEAALARFLAEEQGRTFLVAILDGLLGLLGAGHEGDGDDDARVDPDALSPRAALLLRAAGTRDRLLAGGPLAVRAGAASTEASSSAGAPAGRLDRISGPGPTAEARPSGPRRASPCPICAEQADALFTFFARWQYALATDPATRARFAGAGGFCPAHTWQFQQIASPQTLTTAYVVLVEAAAVALAGGSTGRRSADVGPSRSEVAAVQPAGVRPRVSATCAACDLLRSTAASRIEELLRGLASDAGRERYSATDGLCLPHLDQAMASSSGDALREFLVRHQAGRLEELSEDMHAYSLKRDAVRRGLIDDREEGAWRRALVGLVGERAVSAPGVAVQDEL
jgi:ribosome biogenesis GTPase A